MSYVERTLLSDEKIIYISLPHPIIYCSSLLWFIIGALLLHHSIRLAGLAILAGGIISLLNDLAVYYCSEYSITNKRVVMKTGFIQRQSLELFLDKIEGIYIDQTIIGRALNYGTVVIGGTGGTKNSFAYVPNPLAFRKQAQEQIQKIVTEHQHVQVP